MRVIVAIRPARLESLDRRNGYYVATYICR